MATGDPTNTRVWLGAAVYVAPVGSTAPTDVATAWPVAWTPFGIITEDGELGLTTSSDSNDYFAWDGALLRTTRAKFRSSFSVAGLAEDTDDLFKLLNPGSTATTTSGVTTRTYKTPVVNEQAFGIEMVDGDVTRRFIVPRGEVTEVDDRTIDNTTMEQFGATVTIYAASDGTMMYEITDNPAAVVA